MSRIKELDEMRADLEVWIEKTSQKIGESAVCMSIFTDDYKKGLDSLLQFALALMMEKPIFLLVPRGVHIPAKIKQIADGIEFYRPDDEYDMLQASKRLLKKAIPEAEQ